MKRSLFCMIALFSTLELQSFGSCKSQYVERIETLRNRKYYTQIATDILYTGTTLSIGLATGLDISKVATFISTAAILSVLPDRIARPYIERMEKADTFLDNVRATAGRLDLLTQLLRWDARVLGNIVAELNQYKIKTLEATYFTLLQLSPEALEALRPQEEEIRQLFTEEQLAGFPWKLFHTVRVLNQLDGDQVFCTDHLQTVEQIFHTADQQILNREI